MKPGSSDRCKAKYEQYRCHLHAHHPGPHTSPAGKGRAEWLYGPGVTVHGRVTA